MRYLKTSEVDFKLPEDRELIRNAIIIAKGEAEEMEFNLYMVLEYIKMALCNAIFGIPSRKNKQTSLDEMKDELNTLINRSI